ncbi:PREDICTED: NEP1-interacting protein-like 2 [Nelumbo nucifera]|uniref:RING-type domain-containing protein n=2 Tax=Nelumbo nucifera TaxID=4432 RepID=A0A822XCB8_NELNU|nr:PREDICTED: NEP1-interacting protein-like 2 [Nelumbo nucifera]DAD17817.1 TPA_asm: hypothetical protein HUJ06_019280 [Nelumbo nucifera]
MVGFGGILLRLPCKAFCAVLTCISVVGGTAVGTVRDAVKSQSPEPAGIHRLPGIAAIAGAVAAIELLQSSLIDGAITTVDLFRSLMQGKIFQEWMSHLIDKAYQCHWQHSTRERHDIYDNACSQGMPLSLVTKLPQFYFAYDNKTTDTCDVIHCTICLEDFKEGESARRLPNCSHFFHLICIDGWLVRNGSCPNCRKDAWCNILIPFKDTCRYITR